jgi:adenylate kinase family enzyme
MEEAIGNGVSADMRRVVVVGTSGCGKTTLARELARRLRVPHIELDALNWQENWTETPRDLLLEKTRAAIDAAPYGWTLCGQYGNVADFTWSLADTIIFLDYSMTVVFTRVLRRTLSRCWTREELWSGNRERLYTQFFERDSLLLWVINTWRRRRRDIPRRVKDPRFAHVRFHRFRTPEELERWMRTQPAQSAGAVAGAVEARPA